MSEIKIHELKTVQPYFDHVSSGRKNFDLRKNDRDFRVGDVLALKEYNSHTQVYSGRQINKRVTYVLDDTNFGLSFGFVILGLDDGIEDFPY
jgi:hypothetical protein